MSINDAVVDFWTKCKPWGMLAKLPEPRLQGNAGPGDMAKACLSSLRHVSEAWQESLRQAWGKHLKHIFLVFSVLAATKT